MVNVEILSITKNDTDNSHLISWRVSNRYSKKIFLVVDEWFTWHYADSLIEISFARTKMVEGASVFGYFLPDLQMIKPKEAVDKELHLSWPQKLNTIWNKEPYANPGKGANKLKIIIGYGFSKKIDQSKTNSVEDFIETWQKIAESPEYDITI